MPEAKPAAVETVAAPRPTKRTLLVIGGLLAVEAAVLLGAMVLMGGGPGKVSAVQIAQPGEPAPGERVVETLVLDAKLPNSRAGASYIYATEIYAHVRERNRARVDEEIAQFRNEIRADLTAIWRSAEPQFLQEPRLETMTRKVHALLNDRFGADQPRSERIVLKVVIVMSAGFRIDS